MADRTRPVLLDPVPGRPGEYRAMLPHDAPGRFEFRVNQPETGSLAYRVQLPPGHELEPNALAEAPMTELARATAGKFYREEDLHRMGSEIQTQKLTISQRRETLLWTSWWMWTLVITLFTAEWVVRKFSNMS